MTKSALLLVTLIAVFAGACSTNEPGQPVPGDTGSPGSSSATTDTTTTASEPTTTLPPRPEDLPIDGIQQPCELFTDAQRAELKVDRARKTVSQTQTYKGQLVCALTLQGGDPYLDVFVLLATSEGADAWLMGDRNVDAEVAAVDGFGAAHFWIAGGEGAECNTAVDVADGQHLQVRLAMPGEGKTKAELCETTDRVAAAALTTLRAG